MSSLPVSWQADLTESIFLENHKIQQEPLEIL